MKNKEIWNSDNELFRLIKTAVHLKKGFTYFFLLGFTLPLNAQSDYLTGFQKALSGTDFTYHSPFSYREKSLLVRANRNFVPIEWETQVVPKQFDGKTASFVWSYGMGTKAPVQYFDLYVNGEKVLSFSNEVQEEAARIILGKDGVELTLSRSMIDRNRDEMGIAILKVPINSITPGEAATIKVDGVDNESNTWFMTFQRPLEAGFKTAQLQNVTKHEGKLFYTIRFDFMHLGDPTEASIKVGEINKKFRLNSGFNEIDFLVPVVAEPTGYTAQVSIGKETRNQAFIVEPVKEWTIYLVQHSHTDIGYTRSQTEILSEHLRFIDYALDYCDQTDHYPDEAKFRWTCEAAWTVREYLKSRPESQIKRLLQRIKEGRIEVTGMFFNFSEIVDETALAMQAQSLRYFKENGIDVTTAMQNDVNGIGWCMVDLYNNTGVKYLTMGQHGHRAHVPFDKPTSFWWESPAGNRLLAYRSEHYMHGNALSLTSGEIDVFRANLSQYLDGLEEKGYPYGRTAFQFSGYITDNSPPSIKACEIVKAWNEKYEWPKLKLSLASEFMIYLDQNEQNTLPVKKVAWPDWWTDGFGTAFNETKAARTTHSDMIANMGILSMAKLMGATLPDDMHSSITRAYDELLFYDEHTFGAAESIRDPLSENSIVQWGQKSAYAWTAYKESSLIQEKAMGLIQQFIEKSDLPTIAVFNTLNWNRSGVLEVYIDHEILPLNQDFVILDRRGNAVKAQRISSRSDGSHWLLWVTDIPPMGYATFSISVKEGNPTSAKKVEERVPLSLENDFYKLTIDPEMGVVTSLYDKELEQELIDQSSETKLGQFIYEQPDNRASMERLTNDNRDTVYVPIEKTVSYLSDIKVTGTEQLPIWNSIKMNGKIPGCADDRGVNIEIRLYHTTKKVELHYSMVKQAVSSPEGVYVAFPFRMKENDQLAFEVQGGTVYPGKNELEGTSSDWNVIQNFAAVKNDKAQILFSSNDVPLVHFGAINTGRFYYTHRPKQPHIYSWVLNNYWTTNFKASQEGEMKWRYQLTSTSDASNSCAVRFGWANRVPLLARVIPSGSGNASAPPKSLLDLSLPIYYW